MFISWLPRLTSVRMLGMQLRVAHFVLSRMQSIYQFLPAWDEIFCLIFYLPSKTDRIATNNPENFRHVKNRNHWKSNHSVIQISIFILMREMPHRVHLLYIHSNSFIFIKCIFWWHTPWCTTSVKEKEPTANETSILVYLYRWNRTNRKKKQKNADSNIGISRLIPQSEIPDFESSWSTILVHVRRAPIIKHKRAANNEWGDRKLTECMFWAYAKHKEIVKRIANTTRAENVEMTYSTMLPVQIQKMNDWLLLK